MSRKRKRRRQEGRPAPKQKTKKNKRPVPPPAPAPAVDSVEPQDYWASRATPAGVLLLVSAAILVAGLLAYFNSFEGVFLFDDTAAIVENHNIRTLWPIWKPMMSTVTSTVSGRPLAGLSLAMNYAISGYDVWSYHLFNLLIHLLTGFTLFVVVRRTLLSKKLAENFKSSATWLAGATCLIWLVHPLHTQAVTYVVQRVESMMSLLYLLAFYCAMRSFEAPRERRWPVLTIAICFLAAVTKEVTATLPIILLLYDRCFVTGSFKESLRLRWWLYATLCLTWIIPVFNTIVGARAATGFTFKITPWDYLKMQCNIVLGYLGLVFWPTNLNFDYGWPRAEGFMEYAPAGSVLLVLLIATLVALRYRPGIGFLGAWFFVILGPSSSFLAIIAEIGAEHRMYLPSASVICAVVLAVYWLARRFLKGRAALAVGLAGTLAVLAVLSVRTHLRNRDYHSLVGIWGDSARKNPTNPRARHELALAYAKSGALEMAMANFNRAIEMNPEIASYYTNRGITLGRLNQPEPAIPDFNRALELDPQDHRAYLNRGITYARLGDFARASADFDDTLEIKPGQAEALMYRGEAHGRLGNLDRAIDDLENALRLSPDQPGKRAFLSKRIDHYRQMRQTP